MSLTVLTPASAVVVAVGAWTTIGSAVAALHAQKIKIAASNIHATDSGYLNVRLNNGSAQATVCKNFPLPCKAPGSAPTIDEDIPIPAGWYVEACASAASLAEVRVTGVDSPVADFA